MLELLLFILEAEVKQWCDKVELVISDNCSPDNTMEVVQAAQKRYPISYRRLPRNMGALYNQVTIVTEFAKGKYCWILGDDDLLRPGAIAKMLHIVENNPGIPYIFVNHSYEQHSERDTYAGLSPIPTNFVASRLLCKNVDEKKVEQWEDIVFCGEVPALFTSLVCHVFLKEIWVRQAPALGKLEADVNNLTLTYEMVFPHVSMIAAEMVGKPAYYVGFPYVMFFVGSQEWLGLWKKYVFTFVLQIADQLERQGASAKAVQHYRDLIFRNEGAGFRELAFHGKRFRAQGGDWTKWKFNKKDDFSFLRLLVRHWKNREFRSMVRGVCRLERLERVYFLRKGLRKQLRRIPLAYRIKKMIGR